MIHPKTVEQCKVRLLETKQELINRSRVVRENLIVHELGGDEGDLTARLLNEERNLFQQERFRAQLIEIEVALQKIQKREFGICEETGEYIEEERLLAIPWTRLSIEGAEMREAVNKKYAK